MQIGSYQLKNRVLLAPMAGITDQPFRRLCAYYAAGLTFSEMMSTNPQVWHTENPNSESAHSEDLVRSQCGPNFVGSEKSRDEASRRHQRAI